MVWAGQSVVSQLHSFREEIDFIANAPPFATSRRVGMGQVHTHSRDDLLDLPYVIPGDQAPQYRGATPFRQSRPIIYKHSFAQTKFNFSNRLGLLSLKKFLPKI